MSYNYALKDLPQNMSKLTQLLKQLDAIFPPLPTSTSFFESVKYHLWIKAGSPSDEDVSNWGETNLCDSSENLKEAIEQEIRNRLDHHYPVKSYGRNYIRWHIWNAHGKPQVSYDYGEKNELADWELLHDAMRNLK